MGKEVEIMSHEYEQMADFQEQQSYRARPPRGHTKGSPTKPALIHLAADCLDGLALLIDVLLDHLAQLLVALRIGRREFLSGSFLIWHGGASRTVAYDSSVAPGSQPFARTRGT